MPTKTFIITGEELAGHAAQKQEVVLQLLERAHAENPNVDLASLLEYARQYVASGPSEEVWDYSIKHGSPVIELDPSFTDIAFETELPAPDLAVEEEYSPEYAYEEPSVEEEWVEEPATEEVVSYEPQPLPEAPTVAVEVPVVEETEEAEEDATVDPDETAPSTFGGELPIVSRQKKWLGLFNEAGKLDKG